MEKTDQKRLGDPTPCTWISSVMSNAHFFLGGGTVLTVAPLSSHPPLMPDDRRYTVTTKSRTTPSASTPRGGRGRQTPATSCGACRENLMLEAVPPATATERGDEKVNAWMHGGRRRAALAPAVVQRVFAGAASAFFVAPVACCARGALEWRTGSSGALGRRPHDGAKTLTTRTFRISCAHRIPTACVGPCAIP